MSLLPKGHNFPHAVTATSSSQRLPFADDRFEQRMMLPFNWLFVSVCSVSATKEQNPPLTLDGHRPFRGAQQLYGILPTADLPWVLNTLWCISLSTISVLRLQWCYSANKFSSTFNTGRVLQVRSKLNTVSVCYKFYVQRWFNVCVWYRFFVSTLIVCYT